MGLCSDISDQKKRDLSAILNESKNAKLRSIDFAIKQFVPPLDREDITYIALNLHELNICLFQLSNYKKSLFPKKDLIKDLAPLKSLCSKIREIFENNAENADYAYSYSPYITELQFTENTYSALHIIYEYKLYEIINSCINKASDLYNYLIRTVIKNT